MSDPRISPPGPHRIDVYVGLQVRLRRRALGMGQHELADAIGLTFQQVQKYERGANRISASKLYEIARALRAPIDSFFGGLEDPVSAPQDHPASEVATVGALLSTREGIDLANLFPSIARRGVRRRVLDLVRAIVEELPDGDASSTPED
jgi:transcriptional regulator with XRE-family HTH domain